jgi:hypothetical protein
LEAREINLFNNINNNHDPTGFQKSHQKQKADIEKQIGIQEKANSWMGPTAQSEQKRISDHKKANKGKGPMAGPRAE